MCICTPSIRTLWCDRCPPAMAKPIPAPQWYYPNRYSPLEVTPQMVEAGLAVFHKTFLDRETMLKEVYRAMHEAKLNA